MILVDTGPLVALCDRRDRHYRTAIGHLKGLVRSDLFVCEPVLSETCFHLPFPVQRLRLLRVLERFDVRPVPIDDVPSFWKEVFDWLNKYEDHEPDWADAYLAVLCGRNRKYRVWTYDAEFRTFWRRPDGSRIPMAVR